ncbi:MAG: hypothetical protein KJ709_08535 [Nanoarchaeota archaeon]|nr:hypothetical protein [Nanoarchaeota archaeon]
MNDKLKTVLEIEEKLVPLAESIEKASQDLKSLKEGLSKAMDQATGLSKEGTVIMNDMKEQHAALRYELVQMSDLRKRLVNELKELKLVKGKIHEEISKEVSAEVKKELDALRKDLQESLLPIKETVKETSTIIVDIRKTKEELRRFEKIASMIKEKDFTLERHANQLERVNEEKIRLLKRVDHLEKLVSYKRMGKPEYGQPEHRRPEYGRPDRGRPDYRPDHGRPDHARPDRGRPDYKQHDRRRPDHARPDHGRPDYKQHDRKKPDRRPKK